MRHGRRQDDAARPRAARPTGVRFRPHGQRTGATARSGRADENSSARPLRHTTHAGLPPGGSPPWWGHHCPVRSRPLRRRASAGDPGPVEPVTQDWGRLPWLAPFLRRAFFLRRRFDDMSPPFSTMHFCWVCTHCSWYHTRQWTVSYPVRRHPYPPRGTARLRSSGPAAGGTRRGGTRGGTGARRGRSPRGNRTASGVRRSTVRLPYRGGSLHDGRSCHRAVPDTARARPCTGRERRKGRRARTADTVGTPRGTSPIREGKPDARHEP